MSRELSSEDRVEAISYLALSVFKHVPVGIRHQHDRAAATSKRQTPLTSGFAEKTAP